MPSKIKISSIVIGAAGSGAIGLAFYYLAAFWPVNVGIFAAIAGLGAFAVGWTSYFQLIQDIDRACAKFSEYPEFKKINSLGLSIIILMNICILLGLSSHLAAEREAAQALMRVSGLIILVVLMCLGVMLRLRQVAFLRKVVPAESAAA